MTAWEVRVELIHDALLGEYDLVHVTSSAGVLKRLSLSGKLVGNPVPELSP